jgi:pimeloyl-ACP methyl ester carboxylesterase
MTPPLLLVPAFGCDARLYQPQLDKLQEYFDLQVLVPDGNRYDKMIANVLARAPESFAILGTSMGGRVALEVALAAPGRVEALCIIGAGAGRAADQAAGLRRSARIRGGESGQVIAEMGQMIAHEPGPKGAAARQAFIAMASAMDVDQLARQSDALAHRVDLWERLSEIECPTLCLWGEHDKFSPAADGLRIAEAVQYGSYVELPACGHFPTLEYPDDATEAIAMWLDDIDDVGEDLD